MNNALKNLLAGAFMLLLCIGLPLLGVVLIGQGVVPYLRFPPLTQRVHHAPFSWPVFVGLAVLTTAVVAPFIVRVIQCRRRAVLPSVSLPSVPLSSDLWPDSGPIPSASVPSVALTSDLFCLGFPWWGWAGLLLTAVTWLLAWNRWRWFGVLQPFTFSPLWFGYILVVNALAWKRSGHCMLTDRPRLFAALFPVSALFWWYFEYLNRFVRNWIYVGVAGFSPGEYVVFATLPFSTVLPAVLGTCEFLRTFPGLARGLEDFRPLRIRQPRIMGWAVLVLACAGLTGIAIWPDYLFPLVWVSPLVIITAMQAIGGKSTVFGPLAGGDWRRICLLALSALICGFFWEMWNYGSLAKWVYTVPFVNRFHVFEMPLVGYTGYLPFGLECAVIGDMVAEWVERGDARA